MTNRLFVSHKPKGIVCNRFLGKIKRKYGIKSAGFSGTLDPFANGVLIIAFGQYTKLFRFLKKSPKTYRATLWIGATSQTLDNENISKVSKIMPYDLSAFDIIFNSLKGKVEFIPPKYSAKKVDGKRAYELARSGKEFELKKQIMEVYDIKLIHYMHPFLTFQVSVSEGGYVRSVGEIIAQKLGFNGALTSLTRLNEGKFIYENEKELNPLEYLDLPQNEYLNNPLHVKLGKKLDIKDFKFQENGTYFVCFEDEFAIITIENKKVRYELNKVKLC